MNKTEYNFAGERLEEQEKVMLAQQLKLEDFLDQTNYAKFMHKRQSLRKKVKKWIGRGIACHIRVSKVPCDVSNYPEATERERTLKIRVLRRLHGSYTVSFIIDCPVKKAEYRRKGKYNEDTSSDDDDDTNNNGGPVNGDPGVQDPALQVPVVLDPLVQDPVTTEQVQNDAPATDPQEEIFHVHATRRPGQNSEAGPSVPRVEVTGDTKIKIIGLTGEQPGNVADFLLVNMFANRDNENQETDRANVDDEIPNDSEDTVQYGSDFVLESPPIIAIDSVVRTVGYRVLESAPVSLANVMRCAWVTSVPFNTNFSMRPHPELYLWNSLLTGQMYQEQFDEIFPIEEDENYPEDWNNIDWAFIPNYQLAIQDAAVNDTTEPINPDDDLDNIINRASDLSIVDEWPVSGNFDWSDTDSNATSARSRVCSPEIPGPNERLPASPLIQSTSTGQLAGPSSSAAGPPVTRSK